MIPPKPGVRSLRETCVCELEGSLWAGADTGSVVASGCFVDAMDRVLAVRWGAQPLREAALAVDDEFALAWSMLGGQLWTVGGVRLLHRVA